jgi:cyclophilin family peptidyl-prolyl cis-trans isomerase
LLGCFADGKNADVLRDRTITQAAQRLSGGTTFEQIEPLLAIAALARTRPGPSMQALRDSLLKHSDARVRDAAGDVPGGERAPGPRALAMPEPAVGTLPLAAILRTARGDITIAFERELAPRTIKSFADLAAKGTFNNTIFHRVIGDFVSQGGDPRGDGSGGPGFTLPCESSDAAFTRGAVGMATAGQDTGGSQFFLTHSHQPHLDGRYTLFARVVDGDDVMDALQKDDLLLSVEMTTALRPSVAGGSRK